MIKNFVLKMDLYGFDVMVSVDESDKVLVEKLMSHGNTSEDCHELLNMPTTTRGRCVMLITNHTVIRLKILPDKYELMGVVAHEVFHATTFIMDKIGMKLKINVSDEAYAYMIGFLTKSIYKKLKL